MAVKFNTIITFCSKHLFIPNFVGESLKCGYTKITTENRHLIESCYEARWARAPYDIRCSNVGYNAAFLTKISFLFSGRRMNLLFSYSTSTEIN